MANTSYQIPVYSRGFSFTEYTYTIKIENSFRYKWKDEVGKNITDHFERELKEVNENLEKAVEALYDCAKRIPNLRDEGTYNRQITKIGLLKVNV